jgi:hypothetical protein
MSTAQLRITYDGDIVHEGNTMDVHTYANSLVSLADAYGRAAKHLHPGDQAPRVEIKATGAGSFAVTLVVTDPGWLKTVFDALHCDGAEVSANAAALVAAVGGAIGLLKRIRGRRYTKQPSTDGSNTTITCDDATINVATTIVTIAEDPRFARDIAGFTEPVFGTGTNQVTITGPDSTPIVITGDDGPAFNQPTAPKNDANPPVEVEMTLTVATVKLEGRAQWQFRSTENAPITAKITDEAF